MDTSDFSELLQKAENLYTTIEGTSELPKVERSLRQVLEDSQDLYARVARTGSQDVQANLLLGSQGVDLPKIVQKLETISTKRTFEPLKPTFDTDVESFLENHLQNIIVGVVEGDFKRCAETSKKTAWEHQRSEWTQERMKILNAMTAPSHDLLLLGRQSSVFLDAQPSISNMIGSQESIYAQKITNYNRSVMQGSRRCNLVSELADAVQDFKDPKVSDMWEIMKYMTDKLPPFPAGENAAKIRNNKPVIRSLIDQAKRYLEDRYKVYMNNVINENLAEARRGGIPGTYSLVRSFVGVRLQGEYSGLQGGLVDDRPVWPVVYYCLRSGDISAAIYCLKKCSSERADIVDVINLLEMKFKNPDNLEIAKLETNLQFEYRRLTHNSTDPFQRIVYDILCCCDTSDEHSEVAKTADDYLWLKLNFLRINAEKDDSEAYRSLQCTILEKYGEIHYNAMNQPHVYFQVLALTGQFEAALEFLARVERYQIHSVHMAIALNELHILALSYLPSAPLLSIDPVDYKPTRRLNISRLVMIYVRKFELSAPDTAVDYYYTLRNITNEKTNMFVTCIIDLAVEIHTYEKLFGKMQKSGLRSKGYLDNFISDEIKIEDIAQAVGEALVNKGLFEDAVELFDIANNHEEVLNLLCTLLSQVVHLQTEDGSLRQRLPMKVEEIANRYSSIGYNCSSGTVSSFLILKDLLIFFDQYHAKQYPLALKTLDELQLIPLQQSDVEERVNTFKRYNLDVCKVIPDVVLATINMLFAQYQKAKASEYIPNKYQDVSQEKQLAFLRAQAKALTSFTGMLPYRMPGDTNSRLVQMEILMH